jgi:hypothetical protein
MQSIEEFDLCVSPERNKDRNDDARAYTAAWKKSASALMSEVGHQRKSARV